MQIFRYIVLLGLCSLFFLGSRVYAAESVSGGFNFTVAIKEDHSLWTFGDNLSGQLGNGGSPARLATPTRVGSGFDWQSVSAAANEVFAVKFDGSLWYWGNGVELVPVRIGTDYDWEKVESANTNRFGLKKNGTLWEWSTSSPTPTRVGLDSDWSDVKAGPDTVYVIKANGTLWTKGLNGQGQLGLGDTVTRNTLTQVGGTGGWKKVSTRSTHVIALKTNGTIWGWGENSNGQLGTGNSTNRLSPVQIGTDTTWADVSAGLNFSGGVKSNGTLWAWGANAVGQLGLGNTTPRNVPVQVGTETTWKNVHFGSTHALATRSDRSLWATGSGGRGQLGNGAYTASFPSYGQVSSFLVPSIGSPPLIASSRFETRSVTSSSAVLEWDANAQATGYTLKRNGVTVYTGPLTSFDDVSLFSGTNYTYTLSSYNAYGSSPERTLSFTTPAGRIYNLIVPDEWIDFGTIPVSNTAQAAALQLNPITVQHEGANPDGWHVYLTASPFKETTGGTLTLPASLRFTGQVNAVQVSGASVSPAGANGDFLIGSVPVQIAGAGPGEGEGRYDLLFPSGSLRLSVAPGGVVRVPGPNPSLYRSVLTWTMTVGP